MQGAGLADGFQLAFQADHMIVDGAAVGFHLGLTGSADKAEAAALAFEMGPGANEAGALIAEGRQFDLQHAFAGAGAVGKDFEDQAGAVQQFDAPFLFQIALLHRAYHAIDQHEGDFQVVEPGFEVFDLAGAEQQTGLDPGQPHHLGPLHL